MNRKKVDSSMIASIGYDSKTRVLEIEFNSGAVWQYHPVSKSVYTDMKDADSLGRFFRSNIKDVYEEVQIR